MGRFSVHSFIHSFIHLFVPPPSGPEAWEPLGLRPSQPGLRPSQPGLAGWPRGGDGRTNVQKISPFYRTLSPIRAANLLPLMKTKIKVEQSRARESLTIWCLWATYYALESCVYLVMLKIDPFECQVNQFDPNFTHVSQNFTHSGPNWTNLSSRLTNLSLFNLLRPKFT